MMFSTSEVYKRVVVASEGSKSTEAAATEHVKPWLGSALCAILTNGL